MYKVKSVHTIRELISVTRTRMIKHTTTYIQIHVCIKHATIKDADAIIKYCWKESLQQSIATSRSQTATDTNTIYIIRQLRPAVLHINEYDI